MTSEFYFRPVIETGTSYGAVVHAEAGDADDVQRSVRRRTQARNVAGVWWNLRFDKRDGKHDPV
jgi:hypothetical protein